MDREEGISKLANVIMKGRGALLLDADDVVDIAADVYDAGYRPLMPPREGQ